MTTIYHKDLTGADLHSPGGGQKARAYAGAAQSIPDSTWTKINIDTASFDPSSIVDTTNKRIKPTLAGYYQVSGMGGLAAYAVTMFLVSIYKNGVEECRGLQISGSTYGSPAVGLVYCNGSTDYLELMIYQTSAGARNLELGAFVNFLSVVGPF